MGTYNQWFINVNTDDKAFIEEIINFRTSGDFKYSKEPTWAQFAFCKWCESTKWNPCDLLVELSKKYPKLIFSCRYSGQSGTGKIFFFNGESIEETEIWHHPPFPNLPLLKKSLTILKIKMENKAKELALQSLEKAEKEKLVRIQALENELQQLKR